MKKERNIFLYESPFEIFKCKEICMQRNARKRYDFAKNINSSGVGISSLFTRESLHDSRIRDEMLERNSQ
jgi:hypothetical protein